MDRPFTRWSLLCCTVLLAPALRAQQLPPDEFQVNVSGYFDTFHVNVLYPSFSLTRHVSETTSLTGRYLVDMITAASIRQNGSTTTTGAVGGEGEDDDRRRVDAVTSASSRGGFGFQGPSFDDVRHEVVLGGTQLLGSRTLTVNGIYSHEHDYSSSTVAATLGQSFARKNTTLQLGFVRSWDSIFPVGKSWTRSKDVKTVSASLSQILGKRLIAQVLYSYSDYSGYMSDGYEFVTVGGEKLDPVYPGTRIRQAASARFKVRLDDASSLQLGYRYYWDTWDVRSHTVSSQYQRHVSPVVTLGVGLRTYVQSRAYFFQPVYRTPQPFMTVDDKLDRGYSNELQFEVILNGGGRRASLMADDRLQLVLGLNLYLRHTASPDWFSGKRNMFATFFNTGIRFRF